MLTLGHCFAAREPSSGLCIAGRGTPGRIPRGICGMVEVPTHGVGIPQHLPTASQLGGRLLATAPQGWRTLLNLARGLWHGGDSYTWNGDTLTLGHCFAAWGSYTWCRDTLTLGHYFAAWRPSFANCVTGRATLAKSRAGFTAW